MVYSLMGKPGFCLLFCLAAFFYACAGQEIHIHDRHGSSYPLIAQYAKQKEHVTLVLLDYHHDTGPCGTGLTSINWVGELILSGRIEHVTWISGRGLLLPNRNARMHWLERSLATYAPGEAERIRQCILLGSWEQLQQQRIPGPVVVSLDLDVLAVDPGGVPVDFLDEIVQWLHRQKPELITVALSAAYQQNAELAWQWLDRFVKVHKARNAEWFLESGGPAPHPESNEEQKAWAQWRCASVLFAAPEAGFYRGDAQWLLAPHYIRQSLLAKKVQAGDAFAVGVIDGWNDPDRARLEAQFPATVLRALLQTAAATIAAAWQGTVKAPAMAECENFYGDDIGKAYGIAIRIKDGRIDRGCLALYTRVKDPQAAVRYCALAALDDPRYPRVRQEELPRLELEISLFGAWQKMNNARDFRLGLDSVLVEKDGERTLLQASLANERQYAQEGFLKTLHKKAGLKADGEAVTGACYWRAATLARTIKMTELIRN
jgi:AMMECR1 domain-containing protein